MKNRDLSLDILRGLGIFLMVFDHVGWGNIVHTYIQSFHMPLFFIVSGYLWKNEEVHVLIKKRFKSLMIPYIAFGSFFLALEYAYSQLLGVEGNISLSIRALLLFPTDMENMPYAPALWFLPCMFLTSVVYGFLSKMRMKNKTLTILIIVNIGMVYSTYSDMMLPFTVEPLVVALFFMLIGEALRKFELDVWKWIDKCWLIFLLLGVEIVLAFVNGSVDMRSARYHNCMLYVLNSIMATLAFWGMTRKMVKHRNNICLGRVIYYLSNLSINAMAYICMNQLLIRLFDRVSQFFSWNGGVPILLIYKSISFVLTMLMIAIINKALNKSSLQIIMGK